MELITKDKLLDLKGKTAVVTGGSMGIGYGISYRLSEAGANVLIASRNLEEGNKAVEEIKKKGFSAAAISVDVSKEEDVKKMVGEAIKLFGSVDILVNNAGIFPFMTVSQIKTEMFDQVIAVNLKGTFLCTKYIAEQMIKQGRGGRIINITSIDALHPSMIGLAHYDASKHGVWGFTKNVALELAPHKIYVNAVAPGGVMTHGVATAQSQGKPVAVDRNPEPTQMDVPLGRMGVPDDIGKAVLFLASDMSSYMTGSQIVVDGGYLLK